MTVLQGKSNRETWQRTLKVTLMHMASRLRFPAFAQTNVMGQANRLLIVL